MDAISRLSPVVNFGATNSGKTEDRTDAIISDFVASTTALRVESGVVELFKDIPIEQPKPDKVKHQSVNLITETPSETLGVAAPVKVESPIVALRKQQVQQQILDAASEADEIEDDDLDVADSFEESFSDLSGFAAAEGFFDKDIDSGFHFEEDERASRGYVADDVTGANSLVMDNLMNASSPFVSLQGVARLGFITEDLKAIQNGALLGAR